MAISVLSAQTPIKTCEIHQTEEVDMFCKICQLPYCVECIQENHQGHSWCKLSKIVKEKLTDAPKKCQELRNVVIPRITGYIQDVCSFRQTLAQEKAEKISRIKSQKTRICAIIENSVDKMIESLDNDHDESSKILNEIEDTLKKDKDEIEGFADNLKDRKAYTSEFAMWEIHKDLDLKISQITKPDIDNLMTEIQYIEGQINTTIIEVLLGTIQHTHHNDPERNVKLNYEKTNQPNITEISTFKTEEDSVRTVIPVSSTTAWVYCDKSTSGKLYTMEGNLKKCLNVHLAFFTLLNNGDIVYTYGDSTVITKLTLTGETSCIADTAPLNPLAVCTTLSGDLLVTLIDEDTFKTDQNSQRLVRRITLASGQEKKTYQYDTDETKQQLFTIPFRVIQNFNTDVCVVDWTSKSTGQMYILHESGDVKCKYLGQTLQCQFFPADVVCDSNCNIIIADAVNRRIHLLHHSGQFRKYLNYDIEEPQRPVSLGLYKQRLWVGDTDGNVTVYTYEL